MEPVKEVEGNAVAVVFPIPDHPLMRPEPGYIHYVSFSSSPLSIFDGV